MPIGIAITQSKSTADTVLYLASMMITVPRLRLFGLMIPLLSPIGHGHRLCPGGRSRHSLFPAFPSSAPPPTAHHQMSIRLFGEAAKGMGMSTWQRLRSRNPASIPRHHGRGQDGSCHEHRRERAIAAYIRRRAASARSLARHQPVRSASAGDRALAVSCLADRSRPFPALVQRLLTSRGIQGEVTP